MNFCTLFDSGYLQRGLALYESLLKTCSQFHLYIMAFDDKSFEVLTELALPSMTVVNLKEFETKELLNVKPTRSRAEYCWTCGPSVIYYFITKYNLDACTYLDADLMFYRSPQILFDEIGDNSVAMTDHYAPFEVPAGRYCVQFMFFRNDEWGMKALTWWRDRCIEWCYAHFEDGKYGDQKYLEEFPTRFQKVYVLKTRGAGIASWNMMQYEFDSKKCTLVFNQNEEPIVFVHFHALSIQLINNIVVLKPATFDINKNALFLFDKYAALLVTVYNNYLDSSVISYRIKKRLFLKKVFAKLKFKLRDVRLFRFLYEKYLRPEYKGFDTKK